MDRGIAAGTGRQIEPPARLLEAAVTAAIDGMPAAAVGVMANRMLRGLLMARLKMTAAALSIALMTIGFGLGLGVAPVWRPPRRPIPPRPRSRRPQPHRPASIATAIRCRSSPATAWGRIGSTTAPSSTRSSTPPMEVPGHGR